MKKTIFIVVSFLVLGGLVVCESDLEIRKKLATEIFTVGFREGFIFSMDFAINVLTGSVTAKDISVEDEVLQSWDASGYPTAITICDSAGVVLHEYLVNGLLDIYSFGFSSGIEEGERYIIEKMPSDSLVGDFDSYVMSLARASYSEYRSDLLALIEEIDIIKKPPTSAGGSQ